MILDLPRDCLVQDQVGETAGVDIDTASLGAQSQQVLVAVLQIRKLLDQNLTQTFLK